MKIKYFLDFLDDDIMELIEHGSEMNEFKFDLYYHTIYGELISVRRLGILPSDDVDNVIDCLHNFVCDVRNIKYDRH